MSHNRIVRVHASFRDTGQDYENPTSWLAISHPSRPNDITLNAKSINRRFKSSQATNHCFVTIVPVMPIVLETLLFSFTISTGSLWLYSLRLDFLYLTVHRAIRSPFPHSSLVPSTQGICSKAFDCLSGYHLSSETH